MPQKLEQALLNRPVSVTGDVQYPQPGDPGVPDDKLFRGLGVALGITDQQPGDLAGAIGGMAGLLPMGRLLKFIKRVPKSGIPTLPKVNLPAEFRPMPDIGTMHDLPQIEIDKAIDLARPRPHLETPQTGSASRRIEEIMRQQKGVAPPVVPPQERREDKIYRLIKERMDRKWGGNPDPRVPDPRKKE